MPSTTRRLMIAAAAGLVLAGCTTTVAGSALHTGTAATGRSSAVDPDVPENLRAMYSQQLDWGGCTDLARSELDRQTYGTDGLQCARLNVPVDYDDLSAGVATVGVLRAPATGGDRIGSVVFNPGGPGASGMSIAAQFAAFGLATELRERFDLVGFDPRGTGASQPAVTCRTDEERDAERAANLRTTSQQGIDAINAYAEQFADWCVQRTGADAGIDGARFLGGVGSRDVAKDMDILRAALGDDKLTYVGYSYGTRLGTSYAEQFGDNVRAMILDGAVDPNLDAATEVINQGKGFQDAFDEFATWCAEQSSCAIGSDPDRAVPEYQSLVRPLLDTPLPLPDGRVLTFDDATTGTIQAMYAEAYRPQLAQALQDLADGDGQQLMSLADEYFGRGPDGHYTNLMDAFTAIRCMDDTRQDPATAAELNRRYFALAPFLDPGDPVAATADVCDFWPAEPTSTPHVPQVSGLASVLVISTTGDPATPYQAGVDLAEDLDGALLTVDGTRHTAYLGAGIGCVDEIGTDYLINLTVPAAGARCR